MPQNTTNDIGGFDCPSDLALIVMAPLLTSFDDSTLIKLTLAGQTECFTVLTERHLLAVRGRIGSMAPNAADADDILQEALLNY
jgi:hypothetical protein